MGSALGVVLGGVCTNLRKMNSVITILAVLAAVLVVGVQSSDDPLYCYVCNSAIMYEGVKCEEPEEYQDDVLKNCETEGILDGLNYTLCRKMVQEVQGDTRIVRTCATETSDGERRCMERTGTYKIRMQYCECEGSKCNTAASLFSTITALVTLLTAFFVASVSS